MELIWERYIQEQEQIMECKCRIHQEASGNMLFEVDNCDNAPCKEGCPFKEVNE